MLYLCCFATVRMSLSLKIATLRLELLNGEYPILQLIFFCESLYSPEKI